MKRTELKNLEMNKKYRELEKGIAPNTISTSVFFVAQGAGYSRAKVIRGFWVRGGSPRKTVRTSNDLKTSKHLFSFFLSFFSEFRKLFSLQNSY